MTEGDKEPIRAMVALGDCMLSKPFVECLKEVGGIEICCASASLEETYTQIKKHKPHVLVANTSAKRIGELTLLRKLKREFGFLSVVILSCGRGSEENSVSQVFGAGAKGFVTCNDSFDELILAIRQVRAGEFSRHT